MPNKQRLIFYKSYLTNKRQSYIIKTLAARDRCKYIDLQFNNNKDIINTSIASNLFYLVDYLLYNTNANNKIKKKS